MTNSAKHTPGPWTSDASFTNDIFIRGHVGTLTPVICRMDAHREADAHLITAAPDLLEALQTMLTALDAPTALHPKFGAQWMGPAIGIARAAIARATFSAKNCDAEKS